MLVGDWFTHVCTHVVRMRTPGVLAVADGRCPCMAPATVAREYTFAQLASKQEPGSLTVCHNIQYRVCSDCAFSRPAIVSAVHQNGLKQDTTVDDPNLPVHYGSEPAPLLVRKIMRPNIHPGR